MIKQETQYQVSKQLRAKMRQACPVLGDNLDIKTTESNGAIFLQWDWKYDGITWVNAKSMKASQVKRMSNNHARIELYLEELIDDASKDMHRTVIKMEGRKAAKKFKAKIQYFFKSIF